MSARISPSLPRSSKISGDRKDEVFAFDGVDALWQSWRDGLTPDASLLVSEWADRYRFLTPPNRGATADDRRVLNGIFWRLRTGAPSLIFRSATPAHHLREPLQQVAQGGCLEPASGSRVKGLRRR